MRAFEYLVNPNRAWAIEEGAWKEMLVIANRENLSIEAVEAKLGRKLDNKATNSLNVQDGVAVIPVIGPIMKYGDIFSEISGATSVSRITRDINMAINDDSIKSIVLEIDSPGGEANGINELAELIYNNNQKNGGKRIESYVSGMGCSAAYWIASATDKIYLDETAFVGSIGVAGVIQDDSGKKEAAGIKTYKFVSDGSENKRPDLETEEGRAVVQSGIDSIAKVFRQKVARNRSNSETSLTVRDVIEKFNRGGTLVGADAVKAGLADGLGSFQSVVNNLIKASEENQLVLEENFMKDENLKASEENKDVPTVEVKATDEAVIKAKVTEAVNTLNAEWTEKFSAVEQALEAVQQEKVSLIDEKSTLQEENLKLKAEAKADSLGDRMVPAQRDKFVATYIQMSKDDINNPIDGYSRVTSFLEMWEGSPEHNYKKETIPEDNGKELQNNHEDEGDKLDELLSTARAFAAEQNKRLHAQSN